MQYFADLAMINLTPTDGDRLGRIRDRWQVEMNPAGVFLQHMADQVVDMDALHHDDDHVVLLAVEPGIKRAVEPLFDGFTFDFGHGVGWFDRIVDDHEVAAAPG